MNKRCFHRWKKWRQVGFSMQMEKTCKKCGTKRTKDAGTHKAYNYKTFGVG